ncbi:MAG: putative dependent oxidoreductase [Rhodospirillales bacterium]|nr:putative dependent oxidoreductase [Rhodospirillales bacterium]
MTKLLSGRVALITGASRGLGAATAVALAEQGAHVVLIARTVGGLEETDDKVRAVGGESTLMPLDLIETEKLVSLGPVLFQRFGRLDIWVANAADVGQLSTLPHADPKAWDRVLAVNLTANQRLAATLDPLLRNAPAGRAIFITDRTALAAHAYWSAYGATKAAIEQMATAWAIEAAISPLKVSIFDPGPMATRIRAKAFPGEKPGTRPSPEGAAKRLVELISG